MMSSTPKWYCRNNKSQPTHTFAELSKLGQQLRRITKRITNDVRVDIFSEHNNILEECERVVELYWCLKDQARNKEFQALSKKIKRSPYNALLMRKFNCLMDVNDRRYCQLCFVLKKTLNELLRKALQSEVWLNWALQIAQLYNKCRQPVDAEEEGGGSSAEPLSKTPGTGATTATTTTATEMNASICSNMYPALLLSNKPAIDFAHVLQLYSQTRTEQTALDLLFGLFNMGEQTQTQAQAHSHAAQAAAVDDEVNGDAESNCSSLEILRILTLNINCDGEFQQYYDSQRDDLSETLQCTASERAVGGQLMRKSVRRRHTEQFLERERAFIAQLIAKAAEIAPNVFHSGAGGAAQLDLSALIVRGMRLIWSYVGVVLDHIILWWIDTPISCYTLQHVEAIRHWLYAQTLNDIPEPVFSTLRGIGEIMTNNFVCNTAWDQLFRLTLLAASGDSAATVQRFVGQHRAAPKNESGTPTGTVWVTLFANLFTLSNNYFSSDAVLNSSLLPVAEQIPILHRIDHSVHTMRLWVTEEAKRLCADWKMDVFFQILEHDVRLCLQLFGTLKLPKLTADLSDILMLVCVTLRAKLICEVNANMDKLKKTTDECVHILSAVCRLLSLANFSLCFPAAAYWQQAVYNQDGSSPYVDYVLDQLLLPTIKATKDIVILKLVLKLICEAWLDYIYRRRIKFSVNGAVRLLNDFDGISEWIVNCPLLAEHTMEQLSAHDVLRMCKGVGKILLRKPEDVISITQSPKYEKRQPSDEALAQDTQLPSEMFVSNQKHWLELRARGHQFPCLRLCCGDVAYT